METSEEKITVSSSAALLWSRVLLRSEVKLTGGWGEVARPDVQELLSKGLVHIMATEKHPPRKTLTLSDPTMALTEPESKMLELILVLEEPISVHFLILRAKNVKIAYPLRAIKRLLALGLVELKVDNHGYIYPRFGLC
jgi:hypothetical protein